MITGILYLSMGSLTTTGEYCIISQPGDQRYPAFYQDMIVYQDNRNGNWDIYGYNLETGEEFQITTDPRDQIYPDIYGNVVVWLDKRDPDYHIYAYDLSTGEEWKISHDSAWRDPAIHKNIIVWSGSGKKEQILGYNIETEMEFLIFQSENRLDNPDIYDDIVVWEQREGYLTTIYGHDLIKNEDYRIGSKIQFLYENHTQKNPTIFDSTVIWIDDYSGEIFGKNIKKSEDFIVSASQLGNCKDRDLLDFPQEPALWVNIVIWTDFRNRNQDIYGLDLFTFQEFQITSHEGNQQSPAIYENMVIWEDNRCGTWDIYGYDLTIPPATVPISSRIHLVQLNLYSQIILSVFLIGISLINGKIVMSVFTFKKISKNAPWSKTMMRDFKRDKGLLLNSILLGIVSGLMGMSSLMKRELAGSFFILLFLFFSGYILWNLTFPYVRTTNTEIIFYKLFLPSKKVKWDAIKTIEYNSERKIIGLRVSHRFLRIDLSHIDEEDRDDFITTMRYPPHEGMKFVYSDNRIQSIEIR